MTKEITKANILQELQDRLKLREWEPSPFLFSETVVPIFNIKQNTEFPTSNYKSVSITSAAAFLFFTVPMNEIWHLNTYNVVFMGAGAIKVSGLYIYRVKAKVSASYIYLDLKAAQDVSYAVDLPKAVRLDPGDRISLNVDTYVSTQDLRLYIDYIVEEIR